MAGNMGSGSGIGLGILVGALLGAVARPAVVYTFWLRGAEGDLSTAVLLFSAVIGILAGIIAVLIASLVRSTLASAVVGAFSGAALAYAFTVLTFLPLFWCGLLGLNGVQAVDDEAPLYGLAMALTGALAGGCGGFLKGCLSSKEANSAGSYKS